MGISVTGSEAELEVLCGLQSSKEMQAAMEMASWSVMGLINLLT